MSALFDAIKNASAVLLTNSKPDHSGILSKKNERGKFQYRYCVIHMGHFFYYETWQSSKPRGVFDLSGYWCDVEEENKKCILFHLRHENNRHYTFTVACRRELDEWCLHINNALKKLQMKIESPSPSLQQRSLSITSSVSSNSTSSGYSIKSDDNSFVEEHPYDTVDPYSNISNTAHYDVPPKPYDIIKDTEMEGQYMDMRQSFAYEIMSSACDNDYVDPSNLSEMEGQYMDLRQSIDGEVPAYVKMSSAMEGGDGTYVGISSERENAAEGDDSEKYEDMSEERYREIINSPSEIIDESIKKEGFYLDLTSKNIDENFKQETFSAEEDYRGPSSCVQQEDHENLDHYDKPKSMSMIEAEVSSPSPPVAPRRQRSQTIPPQSEQAAESCESRPPPIPKPRSLNMGQTTTERIADLTINDNDTRPSVPARNRCAQPQDELPTKVEATSLSFVRSPPPSSTIPIFPSFPSTEKTGKLPYKNKRSTSSIDSGWTSPTMISPTSVKEFQSVDLDASSPPCYGFPRMREMTSLEDDDNNNVDDRIRTCEGPTDEKRSEIDLLPSHIFIDGLEKEHCVNFLEKCKAGTYLIRTGRSDGLDALAVGRDGKNVKHYKIFQQDGSYFLRKDEPYFPTVAELVQYYYEHHLPNCENLYLRYPYETPE